MFFFLLLCARFITRPERVFFIFLFLFLCSGPFLLSSSLLCIRETVCGILMGLCEARFLICTFFLLFFFSAGVSYCFGTLGEF